MYKRQDEERIAEDKENAKRKAEVEERKAEAGKRYADAAANLANETQAKENRAKENRAKENRAKENRAKENRAPETSAKEQNTHTQNMKEDYDIIQNIVSMGTDVSLLPSIIPSSFLWETKGHSSGGILSALFVFDWTPKKSGSHQTCGDTHKCRL